MTVQIPTRFTEEDTLAIDELVTRGAAASRSDLVRLAVRALIDQQRRRAIGQSIVDGYRAEPQRDDEGDWALASAIALTEAEAW